MRDTHDQKGLRSFVLLKRRFGRTRLIAPLLATLFLLDAQFEYFS